MPCPELNRFLYTAVGARWWQDCRLSWDYAQWLTYLDRPGLETWVPYVFGMSAGSFELERQPDAVVEFVSCGRLPRFIGQGLGAPAHRRRHPDLGDGARRVWVHTCTLGHPHALANDQARGFRIVRVEERSEARPHEPLPPWPGAHLIAGDREAADPRR